MAASWGSALCFPLFACEVAEVEETELTDAGAFVELTLEMAMVFSEILLGVTVLVFARVGNLIDSTCDMTRQGHSATLPRHEKARWIDTVTSTWRVRQRRLE